MTIPTPESSLAQASLLECAGASLGALLSLSPRLEDLAAGDVVDPAEFQQLLGIGFTSPSFEQEVGSLVETLCRDVLLQYYMYFFKSCVIW